MSIRSQARAELRREEQRRRINEQKRRLQQGQAERKAFRQHVHRRIFGV